ncbi:hypothetical protein EGH22_16385 [Halomicroarcula sp. F28]|jgi:hypothetical protein|uniref:hypothetical protein n=1 Tax=Haloarcula salinisoli TaxID=2487746 RepID=UPI001C72BEC2|nr:hypothetical protein [Halomicroarcula salinisoli]MBX0287913.1 hypothetical protein [Halomicroarcula salinisoli]
MTNRTELAATNQLRREISSTLRLDEFDVEAYHDRPYLAAVLEAVDEGDFLVLNGDFRTLEVTDVVDRPIEDPADERQSKRVLRLASRYATFGLVLVEYPDCYEATLHILETNDRLEAD